MNIKVKFKPIILLNDRDLMTRDRFRKGKEFYTEHNKNL